MADKSYWRPPELRGRGLPLIIIGCTALIVLTLVGLWRPEWITALLAQLSAHP